MSRKRIVAVIGNNTAPAPTAALAEAVGKALVEAGYRLVTGGLAGVMEAASRGARSARSYREGDVVGMLPGPDAAAANPFVDIVIPTNLGFARNTLVVGMADAVVAVGGGAGTLTEIAMAWQLDKPIVALKAEGWSEKLAGSSIDGRARESIFAADGPEQVVQILARTFDGV